MANVDLFGRAHRERSDDERSRANQDRREDEDRDENRRKLHERPL